MLGPLPPLHRVIVAACALAACLGFGAWLTLVLPDPLLSRAGVGVGAALGVIAVIVLLREPPEPHERRVRVHRR